ncbi:phosphate regulon sensor histidine kinase PhoR [Cobetia sp. L2A1]|uniref:phosphate regulon sensor histidine kinase PhoR n=1 Tax=Cobetia sp. L2A1 TaxID=2686360 RepID=UPI00131B9B05|nr:phosphate regulon sensor histidine kinase PhoR [Cobetia sp. L2A1]
MRYWTNELWRLGYLVGGFGLIGGLLGFLAWGLTLGLALYLFVHLRHLKSLYTWLITNPHEEPPPGDGVWGDLLDRLYRYQKGQRKAQERLRSILNRIQESSEAMRDGLVMLDNHGDMEWWNSAAEQLIGLKASHDRGQHVTNYLRDPAFIDYFNRLDYREPLTLQSPLSDNMILQVSITLFGDNERLVMARDVTRLYQLEEMRRDFVANVSHELRTPLTVLAGYLETYNDYASDLPPRWQRGLGQMQSQTDRMQHLVEDLLTLSRLETDELTGEGHCLNMPALLEQIREDAAGLSQGRHTFSVEAETTFSLCGEEQELRSAISNLVFNAVRYTPEGCHITLRWRATDDDLIVEVEDDGDGIDPVHLPRLTERFYRIDKGRSTATGGTGLGLAIVKHVLIRHQGHLDIDSHPGEGSRFRCHFPASRRCTRDN